jgi:hypothetical protein
LVAVLVELVPTMMTAGTVGLVVEQEGPVWLVSLMMVETALLMRVMVEAVD